METKRIIIEDRNHIKDEELKEAASILRSGGLVAFPTETVYGLGGNALDEDAARKIYAAKGRPSDNPLIAHVSCVEEVAPLVKEIPEAGRKLMEAFWPGPLTMIFPKSEKVPYGTTGGLDTVAIRMPDDPVANQLIALAGVPVAAPSANTSGRPSPTTADHVWQDMNGRIEMIIDGGPVGIGVESTIVDVSSAVPAVLRPGAITMEMLAEVLGEVSVDPAILGPLSADVRPKAPGMKYKHYAPKADLTLVEPGTGTERETESGAETGHETEPETEPVTEPETQPVRLESLSGLAPGTVLDTEQIDFDHLDRYFMSWQIEEGDNLHRRIDGKSYRDNPYVPLSSLRYLKMPHYNFDGRIQVGEMIVNKDIQDDVISIFKELFRSGYQIQSMYLIDNYWTGDAETSDSASIDENNTSAFCYREISGGGNLSNHAYGRAIDINPQQNPYVSYSSGSPKWEHSNANDYIKRDTGLPHVITHEDLAYKLFAKHGFRWGGDWNNPKDYQHFDKNKK